MKDVGDVNFKLKPGECASQTIEANSWRERIGFARHFIKVALCFLKPWQKRARVTSSITRGPTNRADYQDGDLEKFLGIDPDFTGELSTEDYIDHVRGIN